jgi:tetratricopeptide (TPR) repeat protein
MMGSLRKKGWERQYKSDRLACPDRMQNRCYSVELSLYRPTDHIVAKSLNNQGNTVLQKGDVPLAIRYFEKALKRDPSLYGVHYNIAAAYVRISEFEKAIDHLCKYHLSHDGDALTEIETDPDDDFRPLINRLGDSWKQELVTRFQRCP